MLCLHGVPAATSTTDKGTFWFCGEPSSCNFICSEDQACLYDKNIKDFLATNQERPVCCSVGPEAPTKRNYARFRVVSDIGKQNFGRPFFTCPKDYFEWGDQTIVTTPLCKHEKPCKLQKVKKEGRNQGRRFFCCPEQKENGCKFFKWVETPEPKQTDETPHPRKPDEDPLEMWSVSLFSMPPSYRYTVKNTGETFTTSERNHKKACEEYLRQNKTRTTEDTDLFGKPFYTVKRKRRMWMAQAGGM